MPRNTFALKVFPIRKLKIGQAIILGPYKESRFALCKVMAIKKRHEFMKDWKFTQRQMIMVDPVTTEACKMYILTRTA